MKHLKIKFIGCAIVCVLAAAFILTSCEQTTITDQSELLLEQEDGLRNYALEQQLATLTKFEKPLRVEHSGDEKFEVNHIDFTIKSNDEAILNHFNDNSVSFKFANTVLENVEERRNSNDNIESNDTEDLSGFKEGQKFVQIILEGIDNMTEIGTEANLGYSIEFDDELANFMAENDIAMVIDFGSEIAENQMDNRHDEHWIWWYNKVVDIFEFCEDSNGTDVTISAYWARTGKTDNYRFRTKSFACQAEVAVCCLWGNSSKWVRRIVVDEGSITGIYGLRNSCSGYSNGCGKEW